MAKKKASKASKKRSTGRASGGLRGASISELQAEIKRRSRELVKLEAKREALMAKVDAIDEEIGAIHAVLGTTSLGGGRGRRRPRNDSSLEVALANVLKGQTMGVTEVAEEVQRAGYKTTSPNFRTIVNQTLIKSELIKKVGRGLYTAKS